MKKCSRCKKEKPLTGFSKALKKSGGYSSWCKECSNSYNKDYHEAHKEEIRRRSRKTKREYYERNRQEAIDRAVEWKRKNRQKARAWVARWAKQNPEKGIERSAKYRAQKKNQIGETPVPEIPELLQQQNSECYYCKGNLRYTGYHLEHKIPISRGGVHGGENVCLSCPPCNHRKSSLTADEFFAKMSKEQ